MPEPAQPPVGCVLCRTHRAATQSQGEDRLRPWAVIGTSGQPDG
jgi:hypothetical protein